MDHPEVRAKEMRDVSGRRNGSESGNGRRDVASIDCAVHYVDVDGDIRYTALPPEPSVGIEDARKQTAREQNWAKDSTAGQPGRKRPRHRVEGRAKAPPAGPRRLLAGAGRRSVTKEDLRTDRTDLGQEIGEDDASFCFHVQDDETETDRLDSRWRVTYEERGAACIPCTPERERAASYATPSPRIGPFGLLS